MCLRLAPAPLKLNSKLSPGICRYPTQSLAPSHKVIIPAGVCAGQVPHISTLLQGGPACLLTSTVCNMFAQVSCHSFTCWCTTPGQRAPYWWTRLVRSQQTTGGGCWGSMRDDGPLVLLLGCSLQHRMTCTAAFGEDSNAQMTQRAPE